MTFIISKKSRLWGQERNLYYLVESFRDGNKVKRRTLLPLKTHKTVAQLLSTTEQRYSRLTNQLQERIEKLDYFAKTGKTSSHFPPTIYTEKRLLGYVEKTKAELEQCQKDIELIKSYL